MSETQCLLERISSLRREPDLPPFPSPTLPESPTSAAKPGTRLAVLQKQVAAGARQDALSDRLLRQISGPAAALLDDSNLPRQLTIRTRRLLDQGLSLLEELRTLADDPALRDEEHPLTGHYRETAAMAEVALRMVQGFPDSAGAQLRLCAGLEGLLHAVAERAGRLKQAMCAQRQEHQAVQTLADLLGKVHRGEPVELSAFAALVDLLLDEARQASPLRFVDPQGQETAHWVACHSLTTARVAARVARADADLSPQAREVVLAALLHDLGMLGVPREILNQEGPLEEEQRRLVEAHTQHGAELLRRWLGPDGAWLGEAAASHHERLDGTGYPGRLGAPAITPLARLLAVCDLYAALACARPHRPARDPRQALTETLLLAERGGLDGHFAACLLALTFYPLGTAVELADGSVGEVVGMHSGRHDVRAPGRPVVAVLVAPDGSPLPHPRHIDLGRSEEHSIARALSGEERRDRLGRWYPEHAW